MEHCNGIYDHSRKCVLARYGQRISGAESCLIVALFDNPPSDPARNALEKSAEALGWGNDAVAFVETDGIDPPELLWMVEGMDPVAVVLAGRASARSFFAANRMPYCNDDSPRVLCREIRQIPDFEKLMETPDGKQRIWAILKTLPHA